jgi:arsenate reductase (thioredoxin)
MKPIKVLFLCIHNSARSQMAEAYLKTMGGNKFLAESAGLEPGKLNPLAVQVMKEEGIDISNNLTKDVFEMHKQNKTFNYVITVCDPKASEMCPVFPGMQKKINWVFDDPSTIGGTQEEKLAQTRIIRDKIKKAVQEFINKLSYNNTVKG